MTKDITTYILKRFGITVVTMLLAYLVLAIFSPPQLKVERSMKMFAQPKAVFAVMVCMDKWPSWYALEKLDPSVKSSFSTKACGVDAWHEWNGEQAGYGKRTVVDLTPDEYVKFEEEFQELGQSMQVEWFFNSIDGQDGAEVICKYSGEKRPFVYRPFNLVTEYVVDELLEKSLTTLKSEAEKNPANSIPYYEYLVDVEEIVLPKQAYLTEVSTFNRADFEAYQKKGPSENLINYARAKGVEVPESWVIFFLGETEEVNANDRKITMAKGFPVSSKIENSENIVFMELPEGKAYQTSGTISHLGVIDALENRAARRFLEDNDLSFVPPIRWIYEPESNSNGQSQLKIRYVYQVDLGD